MDLRRPPMVLLTGVEGGESRSESGKKSSRAREKERMTKTTMTTGGRGERTARGTDAEARRSSGGRARLRTIVVRDGVERHVVRVRDAVLEAFPRRAEGEKGAEEGRRRR